MPRHLTDKPKYWNETWYKEEKQQGHSDQTIADHLYISLSVFNRWKRELNLPKYAYTFSNAKGRNKNE